MTTLEVCRDCAVARACLQKLLHHSPLAWEGRNDQTHPLQKIPGKH